MKLEKKELKFNVRENAWNGNIKYTSSKNLVEVSIEVENKDENIDKQIDLVITFFDEYEKLKPMFYEFIFQKYLGSKFQKSIEEIREMYSLASISLKKDNMTWWVVFEPSDHVQSIFNHFLRFTLIEKEIVWSNLG